MKELKKIMKGDEGVKEAKDRISMLMPGKCPGSKIRSMGTGRGLGTGKGKGPIRKGYAKGIGIKKRPYNRIT